MATTDVDTAETVPLTPLQKIEVDDKELLIAEHVHSANQLSRDELKKIETEITKALETVEQLGDEGTENQQVQTDAAVRNFGAGAHENTGVSKGRVFEKIPSDPEMAEERTSTETHVHADNEEKDVLGLNEKLEELEESSTVEEDVDKVEEKEKDVPCADNFGEGEAAEHVPGAAGKITSENAEFSDHLLDQEMHIEGETQPGTKESSYDSVKEVSSVPVEQTEEDAAVDDAKEEHEKRLDLEAKETGIPENQGVHNEPESAPNSLNVENLEVAESSDKLQGTKEENILEDTSTSNIDNVDSETKKSVEVIVSDFETEELTTDTETLHDEGVEKQVPDRLAQPEERFYVQSKELGTEEKKTYSTQVEEHIGKVEEQSENDISLKDNHEVENPESSSGIIHEKMEEAEPSESADKIILDAIEGSIINEQQTEENDTGCKEHTPTNETDIAQPELEVTENEDVKNPIKEGLSSLIEQSAESGKIDDADASGPKTEVEKEGESLTEITEEKTLGSPDLEVETGNLRSVELEKPQERDLEQASIVKDAATEKADVVHVTEELQEVEGAEVHTTAGSNEVDILPVSSLASEVTEQSYEEEPSPTSHIEQLLQEEENKYEKREAIIEEVSDEPISTSIDDSITEQPNIVGQDGNLLTVSHDEDMIAVSLDDENQDSNKKEISEHFISKASKIEEEPEKSTLQNDKPDVELPENSSNSSAEKPEVVVPDVRIATTEELADKIKEQGIYTAEYKASDTESARHMNLALTETNVNTGDTETGTVESNADVKEIQSTDQLRTESKDVLIDDAGISILPEEEKDDMSATSKTVDTTPAENIEEKEETSNLREEAIVELEKPHDIDSLQISKDEDAEIKEGEKIETYEKQNDVSSSELPLTVESNQKETSKDEQDDEKPEQIDETPEIVELVPVMTPAEFEDAPGKDEGISAGLSVQEPVEKVEHISQTEKKEPIGEYDIHGTAEELPVVSQGDTRIDISDVAEKVVTGNAEKSSYKTVEESVVEDAAKLDELIVPVAGIQTRCTEEVSTQAEKIEEAARLDHIKNIVQTSLEVVSEPDPDDIENQEKVTELDPDDSEKLKQVSEPDPDDSENSEKVSKQDQDDKENPKQVSVGADTEKLEQVSEPDTDDSENLKRTSEPDPDDSENLKQVSESDPDNSRYLKQTTEPDPDGSEILEKKSEPGPDDTEVLKQVSKPDPIHSENLKQVSEPDPDNSKYLKETTEPDLNNAEILEQISEPGQDDSEVLELVSKPDPDHSKVSEPDPDDTETVKFSEPDPDDSENHAMVEKTDIPEDLDEVTVKAQTVPTNVEVLEKTAEEPRETTVSDEVSTVSVAEEVVTRSFEVITATSTAPEQSIESSVHEEDGSHPIPELQTEEKSAPSQITQEQTEESEIQNVEESGNEEIVSAIQQNDDKDEKQTSSVPDEHINKEVAGAEVLSPPADAFVVDREPDEADKEFKKKEEEIENVTGTADTNEDESEIPVTVVEGKLTLIQEVEEQHGEDEILKDEASKEVFLQEKESREEPEHLPNEAEEPEPSPSSLSDDREAPEEVLQEEKDKDGLEDAGNNTEKIRGSEVLVQPHDNPGEEIDNLPRNTDDTELATSIESNEKITSLKNEEKEETQDAVEPEVVIEDKNDNDQLKFDDNVDEDSTILERETGPEEVQEKLSEEKTENPEDWDEVRIKETPIKTSTEVLEKPDEQPRETTISDEDSSVNVVEKAVTRSIEVIPVTETAPKKSLEDSVPEKDVSYHIPEQRSEEISEPTQTTQELITESDTEHVEETVTIIQPNHAKEENQRSEPSEKNIIKEVEGAEGLSPLVDAPSVEDNKPDETDKDINKKDEIEKKSADTNKDESEIIVALIQGDQTMDQEIKEKYSEDESLKHEDGKETILQEYEPEEEPEHLLVSSASSSNDDGITGLVSKDVKDILVDEKEKDGLEDAGNITENISVNEALEQPHDNTGEGSEHSPSKPEETELAASVATDKNIISLKSQEEKEETQEKVEPEVFIEDRKEKDQQKTDDYVEEKQTVDEVAELEHEPQGNKPSASGLNDEEINECKKSPEGVQDKLSVESRPEDDDNFTERKVAEEAVVLRDEQREEIVNLLKEAEHIEIPSGNFAALKAEEKEDEKEQEQAKGYNTVSELETATGVIIHEDQLGEQLKHLQSGDEESELSTTGVNDAEITIPKNNAEEAVKDEGIKEIENLSEDVVQKNKAVKHEYLPSDSVEAELSSVDERTTVVKTKDELEEILHNEKKTVQVNVDTKEKENADEALEQEEEQGQLGIVSDEAENLEPSVSYASEEKQTSPKSEEILENDREEKSKNDHTESDVKEKEIASREFVLREPSTSLVNDDDITVQRSEEPPEEVQEQKGTKQAVADGDTKMSESESTAQVFTREEDDLVTKIVEAESSVGNAQGEKTVPRCKENTERVEEDQEKDQVIVEKVTATAVSVTEDKKCDEIEQFSNSIEETEQYASNSGDDKITIIDSGEKTDTEESKICSQEIEDEIKETSNENSKSSFQELDTASIESNLESKEPESVEDNVKAHSTIEDGSSSRNLENKVEMNDFETEHNKSIDEEVATADEIKIINKLHESIVKKDIDEVVTVPEALPKAEDKSNYEDGKGFTETEIHDGDALESFPSVEVSDSEVQGDFVETAKETEEEKLESIILVAGEEEKKDLIITETHAEKLQGSKENEVPILLGDENQHASEFVTTNTDEKNLLESSEIPALAVDDDKVAVMLKEISNEVPPESPGYKEAEPLGDENQKKLSSSETLHAKMTEKTIEQESYVEADTTAGTKAFESEEILASVLAKGDEIQIEHERDGNLPTIKDKSSLGLEDVTRATSETLVNETVPDESATEREGPTEQITKDDIIVSESSVNEGKILEPLSLGSPKPEELNVAQVAETQEVQQIQEASHVSTQLKDELNKLEGQSKYKEITHEVEPEEQNNTKQHDDPPSEIVTELVKLQEPETIHPLVGDKRTEEVTSIKLNKEETKGENETQIETPNISEEVGANEVQFQEKITVSPADDKSEIDQFIKSEVSCEIPDETKVSAESPQVSTREVYAGEGKQINEALAEELLANKIRATKETEAVTFEREIKDEGIQDQNTGQIKGYESEGLDLDESNKYDAAIKVTLTDRNATEVTETPSEQLELSGIPLEKLKTNILERRESEDANEESEPVERKITEGVTEGTNCKDPFAIVEKDDTTPSSETEVQSTTRELVNPVNVVNSVQTEGSDANLGVQQLIESTGEAPLGENINADNNPKDDPTPVSTEKDVPTEIQQSTARSHDLAEVVKPENAKKTESHIPLTIPAESLLSDLLQISPKDTIQMTQKSSQETITASKKEDLQTEDPKTDEDKDDEGDEEGEEHKKTDSSSDGVIVEASRDMDVKSPQKKHHGILSGVGIKVKNSISKVKKAITGKSSHPKPPSPK